MSTGGLQPKRRTPALPEGRYFIALRPSARARQSLARLARSLAAQFGGNPLQAHDLHLTLAFVGQASAAIEPGLHRALIGAPSPDTLKFEQLGCFGRRLLWTGPAQSPGWLQEQAQAIRAGLEAEQLSFDKRPLVPHLTLVRGARPVTQEQVLALNTCFEPIPAQQMQLAIGTSSQAPAGRRYRWIKPVEPDRTDVIKL